ncbi:glutathione S-transferase N-terminal domain-containing protein [Hellea balneolensis]|uniref:glutathione S-transferase N-terminal domain-containing protein n=1 Tax=Hellea balneolensis TaxID=287478 RepID=UPI0003F55E27|nr:glutathione S-transferase N-terminal domain-containing protein [Hellea balneolensis]
MKLICHPISPYARKAMILARLHGIEVEEIQPEKDGANGYVAGDNPLGKIPALEWQPEQYFFDSPVICQYLDSLSRAPILPTEGHTRFLNMWQHALGDGLADAVYNFRYETVRPPDLHWDEMIKRHETAITRSVETLENICEWLGGPWTYGNLAIVTALDYASYRAGHLNWQEWAPKLAKWHSSFKDDTHYKATYGYPGEGS